VAAAASAVSVGAYAVHLLRRVELDTVDRRFAVRGDGPQPKDVVIVGIDDATFPALESRGIDTAWPFPRCRHAAVLRRIAADRPKVIFVDIQFTEPTTYRCDNALYHAISAARPVVLATSETDEKGHTNVFGGLSLTPIRAIAADSQLPNDPDGAIRRVLWDFNGVRASGVAVAAVATGQAPKPQDSLRWIDYAGGPGSFKQYSYADVLFGKVPRQSFQGKIVVLGVTASSLPDLHRTAVSGAMSGAEVQANVIETVLRGYPLRTTPVWLNVLLIVALSLVPAAAVMRLRPVWFFLLVIGVGVLYAVAVQLAFDEGRIMLLVYPLLALVLSALGSMLVYRRTPASAY
jgi:CHASE2 domain-containing sensor protein